MTQKRIWPWLVATLLAQTGWGAYPVMARYLQTISKLPSMSIIALGGLIALIGAGALLLPRVRWEDFRSKRLIVFALIVIGRAVSNMLAARYTLAIYVQLINLMTPFIVALLSTAVWHERLPRYTVRALFLGLLGVLLIIGGDLLRQSTFPTANRIDWLGILLALVSTLLLAFYMISVRRSTVHEIRGEALLLVQLLALAVSGFVISFLLQESWQAWRNLAPLDWAVFGILAVGILLGANLGQIGAIRHLGASLVSSTMAWRLVSALAVSAVLLDERLTSMWQALGVILVLFTVTWYLWQQRR